MKKPYLNKKANVVAISSLLVCILVTFLSIGFSVFQTSLDISDISAVVRVQKDIRITGITPINSVNNAVSNYEDYNVSNITSNISLPSSNSTITYSVEVTNIGNVNMGILDINGLPSNLTYSLDNYNLKDALCDDTDNTICKLGSVSTLSITIGYANNGYSSENTDYQINLNFDFEQVFTITYNGLANVASLPTTIMAGESETITFTNTTDIPYDVQVINATGSYSSPVLTLISPTDNVIINRYYKITYVLNGGTNDVSNPDRFLGNDSITLNDPSYSGYIFDGWYESNDFSGSPISTISSRNSDITLHAKFTLNSALYYITYYLNGGTNPSNQVLSFNSATPQNIQNPVKNYYVFDGWYQSSSYTDAKITSTSQLMGNSSLYAKWIEMAENVEYDSTTNTFTATNFSEPVTLTSFIGNSAYDYTFVNATGSVIRRVEVTVSYTNNTGNTSSQMTCELYLNNESQAAATNSQTLKAKKTSGTVTFNLSAVIALEDTFTIKFTNSALTNGTVSLVSFKFYDS